MPEEIPVIHQNGSGGNSVSISAAIAPWPQPANLLLPWPHSSCARAFRMRFLSFMLRKITVYNRLTSNGLTFSVSGKQNRFPLIKLALVTGRDPPKQLSGWNAMLIGDLA